MLMEMKFVRPHNQLAKNGQGVLARTKRAGGRELESEKMDGIRRRIASCLGKSSNFDDLMAFRFGGMAAASCAGQSRLEPTVPVVTRLSFPPIRIHTQFVLLVTLCVRVSKTVRKCKTPCSSPTFHSLDKLLSRSPGCMMLRPTSPSELTLVRTSNQTPNSQCFLRSARGAFC
jgi:hypothetical protein